MLIQQDKHGSTHYVSAYDRPDKTGMVSDGPFRFINSESQSALKNPADQTHYGNPSSCDCPIHATRNNKPA